MKTITLIIAVLLLFSCNKEENESPAPKKENVNKGIKILSEYQYSFVGQNELTQKDSSVSKSTFQYDKEGNLTELFSYGSNGFLTANNVYKYDLSNYLIEVIFRIRFPGSPIKSSYKYNSNGNQIEVVAYNEDGSFNCKSNSKYDKSGNMIEETWLNSDGYTIVRICKYDDRGNMIEMNEYYDGSSISSLKTTFNYDNNGNVIESKRISPTVHLYECSSYKYDDKGNRTLQIQYKTDGTVLSESNFKYMNADVKGNWLRKETYLNNKVVFAIQREIEYY